MEKVPQIVRQRLKAATPDVNHPDAEVLTAFSEQSLPEGERAKVLRHLAHCSECREVLALSLPASETVQPVLHPSPKSWFTWPTLRWGFAVAGIALVASFGVLHYRRQAADSTVALRTQPPAVVQEEPKQESTNEKENAAKQEQPQKNGLPLPTVAEAVKVQKNETASFAELKKSDTAANAPARRDESRIHGQSTGSAYAGATPFGPRVANQLQLNANTQQQNSFYQASPPAPPAAMAKQKANADLTAKTQNRPGSQAAEPASSPVNLQVEAQSAQLIQNQSLDQQSLDGNIGDVKLNPPKPSAAYSTKTQLGGRELNTLGAAMVPDMKAPAARWSINASGSLQRSFDQGVSWQDVNVADSAAGQASLTLAANARAKVLKDKEADVDKIERSKSASVVFRAVSANGPDVWAGGSEGMLYHSSDAGAHWTRVIPSSVGGATLTGEVLTVAFTDPQHGSVSTSTSELWSTQDGGQTWTKQ